MGKWKPLLIYVKRSANLNELNGRILHVKNLKIHLWKTRYLKLLILKKNNFNYRYNERAVIVIFFSLGHSIMDFLEDLRQSKITTQTRTKKANKQKTKQNKTQQKTLTMEHDLSTLVFS